MTMELLAIIGIALAVGLVFGLALLFVVPPLLAFIDRVGPTRVGRLYDRYVDYWIEWGRAR